GHEVVVLAGVVLGLSDLEANAIPHSSILGALPGHFNGSVVVVEAGKSRIWIRLAHQDDGSTEPAAHISDVPSRFQFGVHTIEGGNPVAHQICSVSGAKEAFCALKQRMMMLVPAEAIAGLEPFRHLLLRTDGGQSDLEGSGHEDGTR